MSLNLAQRLLPTKYLKLLLKGKKANFNILPFVHDFQTLAWIAPVETNLPFNKLFPFHTEPISISLLMVLVLLKKSQEVKPLYYDSHPILKSHYNSPLKCFSDSTVPKMSWLKQVCGTCLQSQLPGSVRQEAGGSQIWGQSEQLSKTLPQSLKKIK